MRNEEGEQSNDALAAAGSLATNKRSSVKQAASESVMLLLIVELS